MTEFAPGGSNARMTKSQVKKYIQDMKAAQKLAQEKLDNAIANGEFKKDELELEILEKKLDELV